MQCNIAWYKRMQSLVSLEGYDPELRSYLLDHRWPRIMEVSRIIDNIAILSMVACRFLTSYSTHHTSSK